MDVAFRVTTDMEPIEFSNILLSLSGSYDKVIAYRHEVPGNDHYHGLLEGYANTPEWFRKKIKSLFYLNSKMDYQCRFKDVSSSFISYMSKGTHDPVINIGYDPMVVQQLKSQGYDGKAARRVEDKKDKTKYDMYEMMRARIHTQMLLPRVHYLEIVQVIRQILKDNRQVIGYFKIKDYYDMLMLDEDPGTIAEKIRNYYEN